MKLFKEENRLASVLKQIEVQSECSIESLAVKMNVSSKTVKNDIKELNCLLGGYALVSANKGGCKLLVFEQKGYDVIRNRIFEQDDLFNSVRNRMAYMCWQLMNATEAYLIDDLSAEMKVGRTTTIGDLNKLRKVIDKYQLKIEGKANTGLKLVGNELQIRLFILENIYEHLYLNFPLGTKVREILYDFQRKLSLDALGFGFFYRFFVVMIQRIESGHLLTYLPEKYMDLYGSEAYGIVDEFIEQVESEKGYVIPKEERMFLCIAVVGMRTPANVKGIEQKIAISEEIADLIIEILDRIKAELRVTIIANELFDDFVYHVFFMINRLRYGFHIHNSMVDDMKTKYSLAYKMAEIGQAVIEEHEQIKMTEDEIGLMAAYFGVFLSEQEPEKKPCRIAIVCGVGKIIGRLIQNQLKPLFDIEPEFEFFYNGEFEDYRKNDFDYIVTTTNLDLNTNTPVIYMEEVYEREYIRKKFENIKYLSEVGCQIRRGIDSLFMNLLSEETFFVLDENATYKENVEFMVSVLNGEGKLDDGFYRRVNEREEKSTMILNCNIGFPHTRNLVSKLTLALGVCPKVSKEKDSDDVQIIILLGIPESVENEAVLIRLYDEILNIVQDKQVVDKIQYMDSYRELLLYITEENNIFN